MSQKPRSPLSVPPPHSEESERLVIGACIVFPERAIDEVRDLVAVDDFYVELYGNIYESILALDARREPVDAITVYEEVKRRSSMAADTLSAGTVSQLIDAAPMTASWEGHAKRVAELARMRRVFQAIACLWDDYFNGRNMETFVERAETQVMEAARRPGGYEASEMWKASSSLLNELELRRQKGDAADDLGLLSGLPSLDAMTSGFIPGDLIIVAAPPSMGKTAFAQTIARNNPGPTLFFSLEQSERQLSYRQIAAASGVSIPVLRRPSGWSDAQADAIINATINAAGKGPRIYVDDRSSLTSAQIRSASRRAVKRWGVTLIIVDYLGLMRPNVTSKNQVREQEVASITRDLKALAKEAGVPVLCLCQMNRGYSKRSENARPVLTDLRESGAIEQDADTIIFLWRPLAMKDGTRFRNATEPEVAEIILGKNRNGPTGLIHAWWDGRRMVWQEMTEPEASANSAVYHGLDGKREAAGESAGDDQDLF